MLTVRSSDPSGWRRELVETLHIAGPLAGAQLAYMIMGTTDSIMMGRISTDSLAAGGLASTVAFMLIYVALGLLQSIQPVVAQGRGAGDHSAFGRTLAAGLLTGLACAVPIEAVLLYIDPLLLLVGEPPEIAHLARAYEVAFAWAVPAWMCSGAVRNYLAALGRTRIILLVTIGACFLNLFLNWALIWGHCGLPKLGLAGSGYATSITGWTSALIFGAYVARARLLPEDLFRLSRAELALGFREVVTLGVPIAGLWLIEIGLWSGSSLLMGWFGPVALAAHQICVNLCSLTYMVPYAIATAATVRVGFHIGARDPKAARLAAFIAMGLGASFMVMAALAIVLFAPAIFRFYLAADDPLLPEVESLGGSLLTLAAVFQLFDGTQVVAAGVLRGLKDVRVALIAGIIGYWLLGLPVGIGLAFGLGMGPIGLWWGFVAGLIVVAALLTLRVDRKTAANIIASDSVPAVA
jgi:MATE family multidrug resistance protein